MSHLGIEFVGDVLTYSYTVDGVLCVIIINK